MSTLADLLERARTFDRTYPPGDPVFASFASLAKAGITGKWRKLAFDDGEGTTYFVQQFTGRMTIVRRDGTVEHGWE